MPIDNQFRHQRYERTPPTESFRFLSEPQVSEPDNEEYSAQLRSAGRALRAAGVRTIYLVHGTLLGTDVSGFNREVQRLSPKLGRNLGAFRKQLIDMFAGDRANYTKEYAEQFETGINEPGQDPIRVRRFLWSSENHHSGRAGAAMRLLVELAEPRPEGSRIMLWGHSHAGNVFAILTNLLGGNAEMRGRFLDCCGDWIQRRSKPVWEEAQRLLAGAQNPLANHPLDIVTFGTPIRYGWECRGYHSLLHFINHRILSGIAPAQAPFPPTVEQLRSSEAGDYFQQFFIAGTNFPPGIWSLTHWRVERRFKALLQNGVASRALTQSLSYGRRVPDDGYTLLVDYQAADPAARNVAGHAIYTRSNWLPFHASQVAKHLVGQREEKPAE